MPRRSEAWRLRGPSWGGGGEKIRLMRGCKEREGTKEGDGGEVEGWEGGEGGEDGNGSEREEGGAGEEEKEEGEEGEGKAEEEEKDDGN
jgi:hypothetical protein